MTDISRLRILVAENHPFRRWHCCNELRGMGATLVLPVGNGSEALEVLSVPASPVDVVITDLDMPETDGVSLIRLLGERAQTTSLIAVTGMQASLLATVEAMARAYGVEFLGAVRKPATGKALQPLLALHRKAADPPAGATGRSFAKEEIFEGLCRGQFEAFLQPKVDLKTGRMKGAEALARWRHPDDGLLLPSAFMAQLESAGLASELTWTIVKQGAASCREWLDAGLDATVSVNLSVTSLEDVSFAARLAAIVEQAGLSPADITLEITESAATRDLGRKLESLLRLRMQGFGLSIDDYGTGYSSMARLARVPFTELKIDQSFVRGAPTTASGRALVESSLHVASRLGISAVAEGVETRGEWELLVSLACPQAQGYFVARPMDAAQCREWVRARGQAFA